VGSDSNLAAKPFLNVCSDILHLWGNSLRDILYVLSASYDGLYLTIAVAVRSYPKLIMTLIGQNVISGTILGCSELVGPITVVAIKRCLEKTA
jgi:hypothetical protein